MNIALIKKLLESEPGLELLEYLEDKFRELDSIDNIEMTLNPFKLAIEIRAVKKARDKLNEILSELTSTQGIKIIEKDPKDNFL